MSKEGLEVAKQMRADAATEKDPEKKKKLLNRASFLEALDRRQADRQRAQQPFVDTSVAAGLSLQKILREILKRKPPRKQDKTPSE